MPQWLLYALLSAIFAALTAIFAKAGLKEVNPDLATAIRTTIIVFITWGIVLFRGVAKGLPSMTRNSWIFLVLSACATGASWLFYYRALQIGPVAQVSVIDKGSLVFTILLAAIFLSEPLTVRTVVACSLVVAGMLVLVLK